ncbi:hypothetical protein, partial [Turicimonas muris]
ETVAVYHRHRSLWSMVVDVTDKKLYLTDSNPCKTQAREYSL